MMTSEQAAEAVLDVLTDKGWVKDPFNSDPRGSKVCAGLAFRQVMFTAGKHAERAGLNLVDWMAQFEPHLHNLWADLDRYCVRQGFTSVPQWNDHPSTTEEDVRLVIKRLGAKDAV